MGSIGRRPFLKLMSAATITTAVSSTRFAAEAQVVPLRGMIYYVDGQNRLLWNRHDGRGDGSFRWAEPTNRQVGTGWDFKHVFSGGSSVIYYIDRENRLLWNRHDGSADGSFRWAAPTNRQVGTGWDVKHVFSGGDGLIYYVDGQNRLLWNRHDGRADGSFRWAEPTNRQVGTGWDFKHVFSGGGGVIYCIDRENRLLWNRHDGSADGSFRWAAPTNRQVGTGWDCQARLLRRRRPHLLCRWPEPPSVEPARWARRRQLSLGRADQSTSRHGLGRPARLRRMSRALPSG